MSPAALLALWAQLLCAGSEFSSVPETEPGLVLHGVTLSQGTGGRTTARLTYDRSRAAAGGCLFVLPRLSAEDEAAARLSEALVFSSIGRLSRGAVLARTRRIPALGLDTARWQDGALEVEQPVFGRPEQASGIAYQVAEKTAWVRLAEGDAVTLDPARGTLTLHPASEAPAALAAAEAARAYDGLRDGQALLQWWESHQDAEPLAGAFLAAQMAERLAAGTARAEDFSLLSRALAASMPAPDKERLLQAERRVLRQAERRAEASLQDGLSAVREAATPLAVQRISAEAESLTHGLQALADALGQGGKARPAAALRKALERQAAARLADLAGQPAADGLAAVAAAAGLLVPPRAVLDDSFYRRFVEERGLAPRIDEISADASLGLRRKSERLRSLLLAPRLGPDSDLGREALGLLPEAREYAVSGACETFPQAARSEVLAKVQEAWAACFDPGPLGARKRAASAGAAAPLDASVAVAAVVASEVAGSVFSRDPVSGARGRMVVAAAQAGPQAGADEYVLDRKTGREVLPAVLGAQRRLLSAEVLAQLARAARAWDDHNGRAMELSFGVAADKVYLLGSRAAAGLGEEPARAAPFTITPPASATVPAVLPLR